MGGIEGRLHPEFMFSGGPVSRRHIRHRPLLGFKRNAFLGQAFSEGCRLCAALLLLKLLRHMLWL
jgi:hypothetical protein